MDLSIVVIVELLRYIKSRFVVLVNSQRIGIIFCRDSVELWNDSIDITGSLFDNC